MKELSFEWIVFLKALDKRPLKTWEEFTTYRLIFKKEYHCPNL